MDKNVLINRLKSGDNSVLKVIYEQHSKFCILKLVSENQCNQEDAEDIFMEAIIELRANLLAGKTEVVSNPRAYLFKTCHNMFLRRLELEKRKNKNLGEIERLYYGSSYNIVDTDTYDPRLLEITKMAWKSLSEKCQDILYYFYVDKIRMREIADLMGLSNANVAKSTKSRCYQKFFAKAIELKNSNMITLLK